MKREVPHPQNPDKTIEMSFITEGDLCRLAAKSEMPGADEFESWIFDEVIPSVLRTGGYIAGQEVLTPEELMARAVEDSEETGEDVTRDDSWDYAAILWNGIRADMIRAAFEKLTYRERRLLEECNAICMTCGRVRPLSQRKSFGGDVRGQHHQWSGKSVPAGRGEADAPAGGGRSASRSPAQTEICKAQ